MKEVIIYEFQLQTILDALRLTHNLHNSGAGETCFDRQVRYAQNALDDKRDTMVRFGKNVDK
jgi:hypothetical protein